jgi:outer membrane lipoprotein-sorting protein
MGAQRPAKTGPMRAIAGTAIVAALALAVPAAAENVPLPVPAPLPKTGTAPPAAAASKPETPSLFPFSALFGNKSSSGGGLFSSPSAPEPASPFDAKQRAVLERVSGYLSSVQSMVGKFVQVGPDGGRTEGTFYIQKPGRVRFAYNPPSPIDIIADGSSVVVRDRKLATQDLYPLSQTPLRYLLAERIDLLRDTDVVSVTSDESYLTVVIEQKQLLVGTDRLMIMFDAKDLTLKQWTVTDPQGFDTTVAVFNLDSSKKPDPNLFVINYQRDQPGVQ